MKHAWVTLLLICLVLSCKKKKDETTASTDPAPVTPTYQFSVKANGQALNCNACYSSYKSGSLYGISFYLNADQVQLSYTSKPAVGTFPLAKYGNPAFTYRSNNTTYQGRGSITITRIDTSSTGSIKSFIATFSCKTDTVNSVSFDMTEGNINVIN